MFLFWVLGCTDQGLALLRPDPSDAEPDIQVDPPSVRFDPLAVGCEDRARVTLTNVGSGPLDVSGTWLDGEDESLADYELEPLTGTLVPGESQTIQLRFRPSFVWDALAEVVVDSDDPDEPRLRVPVVGASFDPTWTLDVFEQEPDRIDVLWVIDVGHIEMGDEAGLEAMRWALTEPLASGHNAGFYRDDARLAVIFLSDEPDHSPLDVPGYASFLTSLKLDPADIFIAAIVGDRGEGCSNDCGAEQAKAGDGSRYLDLAETFGGFEESICTCTLAPAMERIGFESTLYVRAFDLSETPGVPSMLEVWVDGVPAGGWTYDPLANNVVFDAAPPVGAEIVIRYPVDNPCE